MRLADGAMLADLAEDIVNNINDKPVDLHDALHSIFNGVCRRAAMSSRDKVEWEHFAAAEAMCYC